MIWCGCVSLFILLLLSSAVYDQLEQSRAEQSRVGPCCLSSDCYTCMTILIYRTVKWHDLTWSTPVLSCPDKTLSELITKIQLWRNIIELFIKWSESDRVSTAGFYNMSKFVHLYGRQNYATYVHILRHNGNKNTSTLWPCREQLKQHASQQK